MSCHSVGSYTADQTLSAFHLRERQNAFRCRGVHLQFRSVRPLESIAEMQPQLQPALLRLSAMISHSDAVIRVYDEADNVIETRAHAGEFRQT